MSKSHAIFGRASAMALAAVALAGAAQARTLQPRDLASLDRMSDAQVSPDGTLAVYDLRKVDFDANRSSHSLWLVPTHFPDRKGVMWKTAVRLSSSEGGATNPRWNPDGKAIYFLSHRSGSTQVWKTGPDGAKATQVTNLPLDVQSFRLAPDGKTLVVAMAVFPDAEAPEATAARQKAEGLRKASGRLFTKLFVRHWDEWADGTRNHLFSLGLNADGIAEGAARPIMAGFDGDAPSKPDGDDHDFAISPDSKTVVFSARLAGRTEPWSTNFDLYATPIDGSAPPKDLTAGNPAWDAQPVFSPDGSKLAYRAQKRPGFESDRFGVMVMDLKSGKTQEVDAAFDRSADQIAWSLDGKSLYLTAADAGQEKLYQLDPAKGVVRELTHQGHVSDFAVSKAGVTVSMSSLAGPDQLYRLTDTGEVQLTHVGEDQLVDVQLGAFEPFTFAGWNGESVHGYVVKPAGYQAGHKYPVAFIIHGGPEVPYANGWGYRWNPQTYAAQGFAVVLIEFHGTPGYGQAFTDAIAGHWGDRPLEDLQKGWAAALAKYDFLDGEHACALGASYGGFMVNWIAGNWSAPWKCLVSHDGIFDNRMMGYSTEELWFSEWENGHATPWADPAAYEKFNPDNHVTAWNKPMLIIHSERDFRIPEEQGLAAFTALQRKGVPSEFLTFPDENHWVLKPQNSVQWQETVLGWLKRWTK